MAVLRSKRNISRYEFEHTFHELYELSRNNTTKIATRRKKWLTQNIDYIMNRAANFIMSANTNYFEEGLRDPNRLKLMEQAKECLISLEKPLIVLWNVEKYPFDKMAIWVSLINKEIALLSGFNRNYMKAITKNISVLDWNKIRSTKFLSNMCELHRYTHGKVVHTKRIYDDNDAVLLIEFVNEALYQLIKANEKIPENKSEYLKRKECISEAISCLRKMNRPMIFYFNLMQYSENTMRTWSKLLSEELKMLYALQKSDSKRFGNLK